MISIITVNWDSYEFLRLLIESLEHYSSVPYGMIVIDNSTERQEVRYKNVHQFFMPTNIGHGRGLNHGVAKAYDIFYKHQYLMFLDVDCHFLIHRWEVPFLNAMKNYELVGGKGVPVKPIRPACMFMRREIGRYDWADTAGYRGNRVTPGGFDVGIKAYYKILADGHRVGFLESKPNRYGTLNGEEWSLDNVPLIYHHWHGSHLAERNVDFPGQDLKADKQKLFSKIPWRQL